MKRNRDQQRRESRTDQIEGERDRQENSAATDASRERFVLILLMVLVLCVVMVLLVAWFIGGTVGLVALASLFSRRLEVDHYGTRVSGPSLIAALFFLVFSVLRRRRGKA